MPHHDPKTGELVIRIVYDGSAEAGKTTSIQGLCALVSLQRRGAMASPGADGRRTEFFDWLDFSGGFVDGRRLRCQLVSVPGQVELQRRRQRLLHSADAVVFVVDSRPEALEECRLRLEEARQTIATLPGPPVGLVLQVNKRDVPGALPLTELSEQLKLDSGVAIVPSVALNGDGLMHAFVLATRLATDRARAMRLGEGLSELPEDASSPAALHAALVALERTPSGSGGSGDTGASEDSWLDESPFRMPPRSNEPPAMWQCSLHSGLDISAGHVWPPVKGRALLSRACTGPFETPDIQADWAPRDAFEVTAPEDWSFHSTANWLFGKEPDARAHLLALVRGQVRSADLIPDGRALFLAAEGSNSRIWMLTRRLETLRQSLVRVLRARNEAALSVIFNCARELDARFGPRHTYGLDDISIDGKVSILCLPSEDAEPSRGLGAELQSLCDLVRRRGGALGAWLGRTQLYSAPQASAQAHAMQ